MIAISPRTTFQSCIRTWEGWLYLAIILDVFSRRIVGWAMGTGLHTWTLYARALRTTTG